MRNSLKSLGVVLLLPLTGEMLAEVFRGKGGTAGSLDGWGWKELKALPEALVRCPCSHSEVGETGVWPERLLDACITTIPVGGDATPLGQRPLSALPAVYRMSASAPMVQLEEWFRSWVPDSVFTAGGGRCSVEAWNSAALDVEEVVACVVDSDIYLFLADVIKSFDS